MKDLRDNNEKTVDKTDGLEFIKFFNPFYLIKRYKKNIIMILYIALLYLLIFKPDIVSKAVHDWLYEYINNWK